MVNTSFDVRVLDVGRTRELLAKTDDTNNVLPFVMYMYESPCF